MAEYTPTTDEVRERFIDGAINRATATGFSVTRYIIDKARADFDRWLAEVRREAAEKPLSKGPVMTAYEPSAEAVEAAARAMTDDDPILTEMYRNQALRALTAAGPIIAAEVERLRGVERGWQHDRSEWEKERDEARRQVADLRAGIEALLPGETVNVYAGGGNLVSQRRVVDPDHLRALLAGSGEQPGKGERAWLNADPRKAAENLRAVVGAGERPGEVYGPRPAACCGKCPPIEGGGYDCTCEGNPRCVRERVRDVFVNAERRESFGGTDIDALTDAVLAAVGQGVTVEWGVGYGDQHRAALSREYAEEWIADDDAWNPGEERWLVMRQVGPWTRAAARPTGQEGDRG